MKEILARDDEKEAESSSSGGESSGPGSITPPPPGPVLVSIADIAGVTPPAMGETPVTEITANDEYSGSVEWKLSESGEALTGGTFAALTAYTATITLEPKAGYTLTGLAENFFTVAGTSTPATNPAGSPVVTAVFPATEETPPDPVSLAVIGGVTPPARGAAPVTAVTETTEYTGTVTWSPAVSGTFAASTAYTATITLTAKTGYTFSGVAANFFTVAGTSGPAANPADSGVVKAVFPATEAAPSVPVSIAAIAGVTPPATGAAPKTEITANDQYTGSVTWSPAVSGTFAASTSYTATITLEAKTGYTFSGVAANFFTVAGTSGPAANAVDSPVVTAVFPATAADGPPLPNGITVPGLYTESGINPPYTYAPVDGGPNPASDTFPKEVFDYVSGHPNAAWERYYMAINRDYEADGDSLVLAGNTSGSYHLTIEGMGSERTIRLKAGSTGSLVKIDNPYPSTNSITLILENNITLRGHDDNTASLVYVESVSNDKTDFSMRTGSKVTGNTVRVPDGDMAFGGGVYMRGGILSIRGTVSENRIVPAAWDSQGYGGGVFMSDGLFYMMIGGTISGNEVRSAGQYSNTSAQGGGVYVQGGTFTLSSGTISGNTVQSDGYGYSAAEASGGGVYAGGGDFIMEGGSIEGNGVTATGSNPTARGGGVYASSDFSKTLGTITGEDGPNANTVSPPSPTAGYAVHAGDSVSQSGTWPRFRNKTAGDTVPLDSSDYAGQNGWDDPTP